MEKASTKHTFLQLQVVHIPSIEIIILICSQVANIFQNIYIVPKRKCTPIKLTFLIPH